MKKPFYRNTLLAKCLVIFIASFPAIVFLITQPWIWEVKSAYVYVGNIGKLFGLMGIGFFATNLLLSGRYRFMDTIFDGLDKLYLFHRKVGETAFLLLSAHVLFITSRNIFISQQFYLSELMNLSDIPQNIGKLTYTGLLIIIGLTLFWKGKYEIVKTVHKFLGFLLFFGGLHAFTMKTDVYTNPYLQFTVFTLVTVALISYIFRTLLERFFVKKYKGEVVAVDPVGQTVNQVSVKLNGKKFDHMPGQFSWIRFVGSNLPDEKHPFTISSGNNEELLRYSIKQSGDFTGEVGGLNVGSQIVVEGPYGGFTNFYDSGNQVWVAGGIGITPFMSMIRSIDQAGGDFLGKIKLLFTYRGEEDKVFIDELSGYANKYDWFEVVLCDTEERERLKIEEIYLDSNRNYYICGPSKMIKGIARELKAKGVKQSNIHYELFILYR
ncbi:MAG: ferric reductase-like transmembrane domain-containing protein [Candidatus Dojkabacteria bacterium]|nr:MAG: ferric reductase-like transmembrane domain-containing protein [Candidatus Dojkabacteria bacterium]